MSGSFKHSVSALILLSYLQTGVMGRVYGVGRMLRFATEAIVLTKAKPSGPKGSQQYGSQPRDVSIIFRLGFPLGVWPTSEMSLNEQVHSGVVLISSVALPSSIFLEFRSARAPPSVEDLLPRFFLI